MKWLSGMWFEAVLVAAILLVLTFAAHGAVGKQPASAFGPVYIENPNAYLLGSIKGGASIDNGAAINIEFAPAHAGPLATQTILFCGNRAASFTDDAGGLLQGPRVITYRKAASRLVLGVPCHDLIAVEAIK